MIKRPYYRRTFTPTKSTLPRDVAIFILIAALLLMGWFTFFKGDNSYKRRVRELQQENKVLVQQRQSLEERIAHREAAFDSLTQVESKTRSTLLRAEAESDVLRARVGIARAELASARKLAAQAQERIQNLKRRPANRAGQELLNSLKLKTQK